MNGLVVIGGSDYFGYLRKAAPKALRWEALAHLSRMNELPLDFRSS